MRISALRLMRAGGVALAFAFVVRLSRVATEARAHGADVPSIAAPLAAISLVLLISAVVIEKVRGPEEDLQKDLLWGVSLGGLLAVCVMVF